MDTEETKKMCICGEAMDAEGHSDKMTAEPDMHHEVVEAAPEADAATEPTEETPAM